jgi:putative ABC transport system permease protein
MRLLRELSRRKLRTSLTIVGITIGIWSLVVFGSLANRLNSFVDAGSGIYAGKIIVTDGESFGTSPMPLAAAADIAGLTGVAAVDPQVQFPWDVNASDVSFGLAKTVVGRIPGADGGLGTPLELATGRALTLGDAGDVVVLGADIAKEFNVAAGGTVEIHGRSFQVLGTYLTTLASPDTDATIPLSTAQELFVATLPPVVAQAVAPADLVNQIVVYPETGQDADALATTIEATVEDSVALTGAEFDQVIGGASAIFNAIIVGVAALSLIVGGLSVINTMAMSVAERTREIGIKRAIGGSRFRIVRELVAEAGLIGLIGGLLGLALGAVVVVLANEAGRSGGTVLFDLTPGTAAFAVGFSTILGMVAGIFPAWSAARLDPVSALRYE